MEFEDMIKSALAVQKQYNDLNECKWKRWGAREYAEGLVGDVGDLMKLVQAKEGYRDKGDHDTKIRHELCDVLWSTIVIADQLGIKLESEFLVQMKVMEERVKKGEG